MTLILPQAFIEEQNRRNSDAFRYFSEIYTDFMRRQLSNRDISVGVANDQWLVVHHPEGQDPHIILSEAADPEHPPDVKRWATMLQVADRAHNKRDPIDVWREKREASVAADKAEAVARGVQANKETLAVLKRRENAAGNYRIDRKPGE